MALDTTEFTAQQLELIEKLRADVAPIVENNAALTIFCNDHTYVRYLRARQWNLQKASKMLHATLQWRMEYRPELIRFDEIKDETVTGKNHIYHAPDKLNRPIVLMRPRLENTKTYDRQIRFLMYLLEQASRTADERGVGKMAWLLDFEGYSTANAPPMRTSIYCNSVLQNHYPERLGYAVCYHAPMLFSLTWKAVRPFIDVVTQKKILFADRGQAETTIMNEQFQMEHMESCLGGGFQGYAWDAVKFEQECREYDASMDAELKQMELSLKEKSFAAAPKVGSTTDLDVDLAQATDKLEAVAVTA